MGGGSTWLRRQRSGRRWTACRTERGQDHTGPRNPHQELSSMGRVMGDGLRILESWLIPGRPTHSVGIGHREKRQSQSGGIHLGQMMGARAREQQKGWMGSDEQVWEIFKRSICQASGDKGSIEAVSWMLASLWDSGAFHCTEQAQKEYLVDRGEMVNLVWGVLGKKPGAVLSCQLGQQIWDSAEIFYGLCDCCGWSSFLCWHSS